MEAHTIQAEARSATGKGVARKLRATGLTPAIAYGNGDAATALSLDPKQFRLLRKSPLGFNQPVTIVVDGGADIELALLRDLQKHPVSGAILHADFQTVSSATPVQVVVPVTTVGKSAGQELGGVLQQPLRTMKIVCLPQDIPSHLEVDITPLEIGGKIMLSEVPMPDGVTAAFRHDATLAQLVRGRVKA